MNIYKTIKRFLRLMKNQQTLLFLCVILFLPILAACSGNEAVPTDMNNDNLLLETEPDEIETVNVDQSSEAVITPTLIPLIEEGRIAFWSDRDGDGEIYLMDKNGGNQINLTNNGADDGHPLWSPDGSKIVFTSNRDSDYENTGIWVYEIYIMNADGSEQTRLTNNDINESFIDLSPDGEKIVFFTNWDGIYHGDKNSDYLNPKDNDLNWAETEIGVMDLDGSNIVRLTNNDVKDVSPVWSPDGNKIVFVSERGRKTQIYVMNADGSNEIQLTFDKWVNHSPVWSPDGSEIMYSSERNEEILICRMTAEGKYGSCFDNPNYYTRANPSDWSQDGRRILYTGRGFNSYGIYIMNASGVGIVRLLEEFRGHYQSPVWQP